MFINNRFKYISARYIPKNKYGSYILIINLNLMNILINNYRNKLMLSELLSGFLTSMKNCKENRRFS
jgi:hypothetical protein